MGAGCVIHVEGEGRLVNNVSCTGGEFVECASVDGFSEGTFTVTTVLSLGK